MDIMANGRRSWRLIGVLAIMLVWGMAQGFQQAYGESFTELPSESTKKELKDKAIKAIKASHQILEFHYLNEPAPSKKRNLTALALAALAYEVATAATEIGVLSDLVEALEFQYALSCSQSGYSFNQLCQNLLSLSHINDMAIGDLSRINDIAINDLIKKITDLYAQVAKKFHNDLSKGLRIIETDIVVIIYFPDGNNMVLPTSYMRMADGYILWKKYEAFRYYFTKNPANCGSESSLCEFIFTGKNKLSDMRSIAEELSSIFKDKPINSDKLYQFFNEGTNPDSGIVMYHKNLLICDEANADRRRLEGGSNDVDCKNEKQETDFSNMSEVPDELGFETFDSPRRVFMGAYFKDVSKLSTKERIKLRINRRWGGVIITYLMEQSPAEQAGLLKNDIVVSIDGQPIDSKQEVSSILEQHSDGDRLELIVIRGGDTEQLAITVELAEKSLRCLPGRPDSSATSEDITSCAEPSGLFCIEENNSEEGSSNVIGMDADAPDLSRDHSNSHASNTNSATSEDIASCAQPPGLFCIVKNNSEGGSSNVIGMDADAPDLSRDHSNSHASNTNKEGSIKIDIYPEKPAGRNNTNSWCSRLCKCLRLGW